MLETALFRYGKAIREPELFDIVLDENGEPIANPTLTKKDELIGAGIQYIMGIVDYFCTHRKNELEKVNGAAKRMKLPTLTWKMAIDLATGGLSGQRKRAEDSILKLQRAQKPVFIYGMDGTKYSMIPFVIDLTYENSEKVKSESALKLARINKETQKNQVIKYIDIQFAFPLYEGFFMKNTGNYNFPNAPYARFYDRARKLKRTLKKRHQRIEGELLKAPDADTDISIDFYNLFARYIQLHSNIDNKTGKGKICKTVEDIFIDVYPGMIQWKNGKPSLRNTEKATYLLAGAFAAINEIDGFGSYPHIEGQTDSGKLIIGLYREKHPEPKPISNFV